MLRVLFVCLGNICRSPMAEFILKQMVAEKGLTDQFKIASAATEGYNELVHASRDGRAQDILRQRMKKMAEALMTNWVNTQQTGKNKLFRLLRLLESTLLNDIYKPKNTLAI